MHQPKAPDKPRARANRPARSERHLDWLATLIAWSGFVKDMFAGRTEPVEQAASLLFRSETNGKLAVCLAPLAAE
jgi:hypothetical protein